MAVYYRYNSERLFDSIAINVPFISVGNFKERIFESKRFGRGKDFDLVVTNANSNEEYLDEAMLIPKNSSVLIRRVPGWPRMPIVADQVLMVENKKVNSEPEKSSFSATDASAMKYPEYSEWDDFGDDVYAIPEVPPVQSSNPTAGTPPTNIADEESKIKANLVFNCSQGPDGFGLSRGFGRGIGGRAGFEWKTPPQGYVCHRCKVPGHFIQHCPTNGDPKFDIKRVKPPTGIPKSMLMATPDGSYVLSSGAVAVLNPNEAAFEKEMEGLQSTCSVGELPPELHCRLCKEVMKDAVLTSKCCFESFCDKCIRNHIISKTMCVCGKKNILADDLLPNKTLRHTINRILDGGTSSSENAGSAFPVRDMESAHCLLPKVPSPTLSVASKGEQKPSPVNEEKTPKIQETRDEGQATISPLRTAKRRRTEKAADISEFTHESVSVREPTTSLGSVPLAKEEVHQKVATSEADLQWKTSQDLAAENNNLMPSGSSAFNPYWTGMQPGMDGCLAPYPGAMPYMAYGMHPYDMPFGAQGYMFPPIPPPQRAFSKDWEFDKLANRDADVDSMKLKYKQSHHHRAAKRKSEHYADGEVSKKRTKTASASVHSTFHRPSPLVCAQIST
ncbi:E3 ubiquitin ligase PQT3-like isoform X2 [Corylus avellana]|uniref:E3 ubiquitin ligase PQT3-like isoform X2 n=1 Tax=Corylus avellana TaxID=13451 RepID=UPI001E2342B2|nr:E3 ubiquitin ligase PQT3-like isoform X2 [Corylus avellana]